MRADNQDTQKWEELGNQGNQPVEVCWDPTFGSQGGKEAELGCHSHQGGRQPPVVEWGVVGVGGRCEGGRVGGGEVGEVATAGGEGHWEEEGQ